MVFDFNMVVYLLGLAATAGTIISKISTLEKKVEKHNQLVERMAVAERDLKTMFRRLDELREELHEGREEK